MVDVDVHLRWHEGGPYQSALTGNVVCGEGETWPRSVERGNTFFGSAIWKHHVVGEEHSCKLGGVALLLPVQKLWREVGGVVHNQVSGELVGLGNALEVSPVT